MMKSSNHTLLHTHYIDDLFFIWKEERAMRFVNKINANDWGIRLTLKSDTQKIEFHDLLITQENWDFCTSTFF